MRNRRDLMAALLGAMGLFLVTVPHALSQAAPNDSKRVAVATLVTDTGTLLRREAPGKPWQVVAKGEKIHTGDMLIGFPGAQADTTNGSIRVTFLTDLDGSSPYPIVETAVVLRESAGADLDLVLDRGRVDLEGRKQNGAAKARVQVRKDAWELTLDKGANIVLELYGRWPAGVHFQKDSSDKYAPTANLVFLVRDGNVHLKHGAFEYAMSAPPGPAIMEWDSTTGLDSAPRRLEKLPPWAADMPETDTGKARKAVLDRFRKSIVDKSVGAALDELVNSKDPAERALAVRAMGAVDDLPRLANALRDAKHLDVWDTGVLTLRHWIGRGPGQDQVLYKAMIESGQFTPVEAETIVQLLHSYGEVDLARPETYETLIAYLNHDKLAVRGLAHWHLVRLVPSGKDIGYNPMDPKEKRAEAVQKWRKLVPPGTLPARSPQQD
jgi:hypothetical protein